MLKDVKVVRVDGRRQVQIRMWQLQAFGVMELCWALAMLATVFHVRSVLGWHVPHALVLTLVVVGLPATIITVICGFSQTDLAARSARRRGSAN